MEEKESNIWYVMATLVITYFLFRITHIFVITTTPKCVPHTEFWYAKSGVVSPSSLFILIFVLISLWGIAEAYEAVAHRYKDKLACIIVAAIGIIVVFFVSLISRAQYEAYDFVYADRTYENLNFDLYPIKIATDINGVKLDGKYTWSQCPREANKPIKARP